MFKDEANGSYVMMQDNLHNQKYYKEPLYSVHVSLV